MPSAVRSLADASDSESWNPLKRAVVFRYSHRDSQYSGNDGGVMSPVFVSYSHTDRDRVIDIIEGLKKSRVAVWWDDDLPPGKTWDDQIEMALEKASAVVVVWSESALASENVKDEAYYAREENKAFPVRIEDVQPPFRFRRLQSVDLFQRPVEDNEKWDDLVDAISERRGRGPDLEVPLPGERPKPRRQTAIPWMTILPALMLGLILIINAANLVFTISAAPLISVALGALALAALITDLVRRSRVYRQ